MANGTFELQLKMTGLSMFVPEPPDKMHVLMVAPVHHEKHLPRVWYDKAYETKGSPLISRRNVQKDLPKELNWGLKVSGGSVSLPKSLPDVGDYLNKKLNLGSLHNVGCHLILPRGSRTVNLAPAIWDWEGKLRKLALEVVWSMTVEGDSLTAQDGVPALYPIDKEIHLFISNAISSESVFPPMQGKMPQPDQPMAHFDAFYDLYDPPVPKNKQISPLFKPSGLSTSYSCLPSGGH
jgi:hypothetical protein